MLHKMKLFIYFHGDHRFRVGQNLTHVFTSGREQANTFLTVPLCVYQASQQQITLPEKRKHAVIEKGGRSQKSVLRKDQ